MDFFGITLYGPQNYIKYVMREDYFEPSSLSDAKKLMETLGKLSTDNMRRIDCYIEGVNGFAYGSTERFVKMKKKGVIKPTGPHDMFRIPATTYIEYGWFVCDEALSDKNWYKTYPRWPQQVSPNSLVLEKARKNNKYATLF